jgi:extracellular factor (EF) 3-hydroxypalmitic acid methyl ester biosynthesis protein
MLAVTVSTASRISLYVAFDRGDAPPPDRTLFRRLLVELPDGRSIELSSCRLHVEYTRRGASGRLVFLEDVFDCRALLTEGKLVNLKGFFQNLPLVLAQKDRIRPEFRDYVADSMYDLSVYKKFFNEQDRILSNEPLPVADAGREALLKTEGRRFFRFFDAQLERLSQLVDGFDKEEHERHGFYFRRHAWEYILGSEFLKRTNLKPRGYAGDAEMMVMTYENDWVGNYVFNKLLHKHPLDTPAAQAVRNRRGLIPQVLRDVAGRLDQDRPVSVLSVACGPAAELQDVFVTPPDFERFSVSLLDQDPEALEFARSSIARIERSRDRTVRARYLTDSVRTMLRSRNLAERFGRMHFIYSMGLFDYLTTPVARALLARLFELVEPGGALLVGNFHVSNPTRHYMAYWMDWVLYNRTEDEFLDLAARLLGAKASVTFDGSRSQMFLRVDKE